MKALFVTKPTQLEDLRLHEIEIASINPNQILVRMKAAGMNPIDWQTPAYNHFETLNLQFPFTMGSDFSGIVEQIGADVSNFKIGDEVFGAFKLNIQGAFAEYGVIDEALLVHKPKNISHIQAAGIPLVSITALQALFDKLDLQAGQKILIQAAAGGVGIFAVQLAKLKGAYVVAVGSGKNYEFLKSLGADEVFDYNDDFGSLPKDFDAVLDSMNASEQTFKVLKKGGKYVSIASAPSQELAISLGITATNFLYDSNATQLKQIADLIEDEKLKVFVDKTFPFENVVTALEYQKNGRSRGKNILTFQ